MFLTGKQMYDFKKSEERTNAKLKRAGIKNFHTYPALLHKDLKDNTLLI